MRREVNGNITNKSYPCESNGFGNERFRGADWFSSQENGHVNGHYQARGRGKQYPRNDGYFRSTPFNAKVKTHPVVEENQPGGAGITYDGANRERCHADRLDAITFVSTERVGHSADEVKCGLDRENKAAVDDHHAQSELRNSIMSSNTEMNVDEPHCVMVAPKKPPAIRDNLEKVNLLTNFWELHIESKTVYRYEVAMHLGTPAKQKAVDLLRCERDDSSFTSRRKLCLNVLQYAMECYRLLSDEAAIVYDGGSALFSSEDLAYALKEHYGVLVLDVDQLPEFIRKLILRVDAKAVTIEISPSSVAPFDISDLSAQINRNLVTLDRSLKQFYELLTNYDALISGRFTQFGVGCLYHSKPSPERIGYGYQCFPGARKGIKFIEGKRRGPTDIIAALVLDHRVGLFFTRQDLMRSIRELDGLRNVQQFDFSSVNNRMNYKWNEVNSYVKGVRMNYIGASTNPTSFVASGISKRPIKELSSTLPNSARTQISVLAKFAGTGLYINPDWPAVMWRTRGDVQYFPMELLEVAPNQRVPLEKQIIAKKRIVTDNPLNRFSKIYNLLEALNLHDSGLRNGFLRAFGITVASSPMKVEGIRREAPGIVYRANHCCKVDDGDYSWSQGRDSKYVEAGRADLIVVVHSDPTNKLPENVINALQQTFKIRGMYCGKFVAVGIKYQDPLEMESELRKIFTQYENAKESILIIVIDRSGVKSHDFLKLMERRYLIPTQHITAELAEKLPRRVRSCANFVMKTNLKLGGINYEVVPEDFAKDRWIANGRTLIVGYDVAHPGKPTRDEIVNKMPPEKPSVVGISFNGGIHPECFIGDYHFQKPHQEKVDHMVLNARFKWILGLFTKNRQVWPESVVITRDGVSEGQYRMVIEDELNAIKEACYEFGSLYGRESWLPKFTVIVATKRHNARFVVDGEHLENPKPATVVDTDVVRGDLTEFYLQSHKPLKGTAKSTAYQVIVDENDMSMDEVQSLILALTFHHQISNLPVSLPEPVYQADEWAKRGNNIWRAYSDRHHFILKSEPGEYAAPPIDFEAMTKRLAFKDTKLQDRRINA
ncbi:hypothetical protein KIN20_031185 [Parelaphostrongylus tenuis]|uniref:Piwi domain-containing protein n=1 Tax=Parelaphostrongylus tenuis TaxID=148309 RepID=A0AAD5R4T1_PARTN|nr:hypothetical protein KIN20_031185 [Parelaphostrongylus tenuis]